MAIAVDAVLGIAYVSNFDNTVSVVDTATNEVARTIPVGPSPLAIAEAAGSAWVTADFDGDLWRLDP